MSLIRTGGGDHLAAGPAGSPLHLSGYHLNSSFVIFIVPLKNC